MDALGASAARGYNTDCPTAWRDCPENSWSTGTNDEVDSIYLRLLKLNPGARDHNYNDAVSGSFMADLEEQTHQAVQRNVALVTIAMGTNDACGAPGRPPTSVQDFRAAFVGALEVLRSGLPTASILVVSIPDINQLWALFHTDPNAVTAWESSHFCDSLLARPSSTLTADANRRAAVRTRVVELNRVLHEVCADYPPCRTDRGAVFNSHLTAGQVSTNDYWHPSIQGQAVMAKLVWQFLGYR